MKSIKHITKCLSRQSHHENHSRIGIQSYFSHKYFSSTQQSQSQSGSQQEIIDNNKILGKKLFIWGQVQGSSLGLGSNDRDSSLPIHLNDIDGSGYKDISLGNTHCGIVTGKGDVYMFGTSHYGELGLNEEITNLSFLNSLFGNNATINIPTRINYFVENNIKIDSISCGGRHTSCIDTNGNVYTFGWGGNKWTFSCGGLGHNNKESLNSPKLIEYFNKENIKIKQISCGEKHTLCIGENNEIYAFGEGEHGRLGTGHTSNCKKPTLLTFFNNIAMSKVIASREYSFGLTKDDGILYGWGRNDRGQMGQGGGLAMDMYSCDTIPIAIGECQNIIDIGLSPADVLCVNNNGICYYWGERVYLEPHIINDERFINEDNIPNGKIIKCDITSSIMCFLTDKGELFTCNKTFGMKSDIFVLGHGSVQPFKEAKRVNALKEEFITKIVANDHRCIAIAK